MRNARAPARSPTDPLVTPPSLVITPTLESVISVEGFCQFGWFKKLLAVISQRSLTLSVNANSLARPKLITFPPGPLITPLPDVPKRPGWGGANALVSNQRS